MRLADLNVQYRCLYLCVWIWPSTVNVSCAWWLHSLLRSCSLRWCVWAVSGTAAIRVPTGLCHVSPAEITAKWSVKLISEEQKRADCSLLLEMTVYLPSKSRLSLFGWVSVWGLLCFISVEMVSDLFQRVHKHSAIPAAALNPCLLLKSPRNYIYLQLVRNRDTFWRLNYI